MCFSEQSFVSLFDPTSSVLKNVTPYCIRFSEIQFYFNHRLAFLEEVNQQVLEQLAESNNQVCDTFIESQLQSKFDEKLEKGRNLVCALFQILNFEEFN